MLVLHAAFYEHKFYIWAERSFETKSIVPYMKRARSVEKIYRLPWTAEAADIHTVLNDIGLYKSQKEAELWSEGIKAYLTVPVKQGVPLPSSPLLGELPTLAEDAEVDLEVFQIDALPVPHEVLIALLRLLDTEGERLSVPGVLFAPDMYCICNALRYAALSVLRGNYLPDMEEFEDGYVSVWTPLYRTKYQEEITKYVRSIPMVVRGFSVKKSAPCVQDREQVAVSIFENLVDSIVRSAQATEGARGKKVDADNTHEIWIRSLGWQKAPLEKWNEDMDMLYPQIQTWLDSIMSVSGQPWKLFLRIDEPIVEPGQEEAERWWTLSWHLQSVRDPSLIVPACRVWSPEAAERQWFSTIDANPRRYMLQVLGQMAAYIPAVARSLDRQCPVECYLNLDELFEFLHDHVGPLMDQGIDIQFPAAWGSFEDRPRLAVTGKVRSDENFAMGGRLGLRDLLEVDWSISLGGEELTVEELEMLTKLKTPFTQVRGRWVLLSRNELKNIMEGIEKLPQKINRREALLNSLKEHIGELPLSDITGSKWLDSVRAVLTGREPLREIPQPEAFNGKLRPYQVRGLSWLAWLTKLGLGGCLADDMGLGKTVQTLALLKMLRLEGETRPVLLICPTSVMENWRREAERFVPDLPVMIQHGTKRLRGEGFLDTCKDFAMVISSYALLHRDSAVYAKVPWAGVILDEAQNIKNPDTRQCRAAHSVPGDWHIALTGTPVENHVGDMWSIMEFIVSGLLPNRSRFGREFLRPIQAGDRAAMERIKRITGPFILRRLKTDRDIITDLPKKIESTVYCSLSKEQASLYKAVLTDLDEKIAETDGIQRKGLVLSTITALKQLCNHPALYLKDGSVLPDRSGKIERLTEIAEEMLSTGDRALIFTQYAEMGAMLKQYLQETFGRETLFLHGGISREKRDEMVMRFQNEGNAPPFFVLSLKAGGTGLNLTRANHVVMFDRWWNPAVEQQAVDRAYRIGQDRSVQVHYFCCKGTLEEKIEELINSKKRVAEAVVGVGENWLTELSDDELRDLFSLSSDVAEEAR